MTPPLTRRQFFGQAPAGAVAALAASEPPPRAWIIMQADWASGRCLSADVPGVYRKAAAKTSRRKITPSAN